MDVQFTKIPLCIGEATKVLGWCDTIRTYKRHSFVELRVGEETLQCLVPAVVSSSAGETFSTGSYVELTGEVKPLPKGAYHRLPVEFHCTQLKVLSTCDSELLSKCKEDSGAEVALAERHFYLRLPKQRLIMQTRAHLLAAIRAHFQETDCIEIVPPSFTGVECEGGATLFHVEHPGRSSDKPMSAYLTQSSQFALEMVVPALGACYCIAPSFRAEHSHTRRHLTEFTHAEAEWPSVITFDIHLEHLRSLLKGILKHFLRLGESTLQKLGVYDRVSQLREMTKDILVLDHKDAIAMCHTLSIYKDEETKMHFSERDDIPEAQERALIDAIGKIVFLVRFPKEFKSFYMGLDPQDPTRVLGCDVEVPGVGEIVGSGVREYDRERLVARMKECGLKTDDYREYLDLRCSGFGMTSGMGLGVDRMLMWLIGADSIRDVVTFPRFPGYLSP
jgi:asparaginyl-tRNA synthetase